MVAGNPYVCGLGQGTLDWFDRLVPTQPSFSEGVLAWDQALRHPPSDLTGEHGHHSPPEQDKQGCSTLSVEAAPFTPDSHARGGDNSLSTLSSRLQQTTDQLQTPRLASWLPEPQCPPATTGSAGAHPLLAQVQNQRGEATTASKASWIRQGHTEATPPCDLLQTLARIAKPGAMLFFPQPVGHVWIQESHQNGRPKLEVGSGQIPTMAGLETSTFGSKAPRKPGMYHIL
jgi:hypothetical protein